MKKFSLLVSICFIGVLLLAGCGQNIATNVAVVNESISSVSVFPQEVTLSPKGFQQFYAVFYDANNNVVTSESITINWSVSGNIGTLSQDGTFTAASVGIGQVVVLANGMQGSATIEVIEGAPPLDFHMSIVSNEVISSSKMYSVDWESSNGMNNKLEKYQILGKKLDSVKTENFIILKDSISAESTSATFNFLLDGIWEIKIRAIDDKGLWRDSDGSSAGGDKESSNRNLMVNVDSTPPLGFIVSNVRTTIDNTDGIFRLTYLDDPKGPIMWSTAQDRNLDHYEITICTDPNNINDTTVFSKNIEASLISCEVKLATGFYYLNIVALDKAGHYRMLSGKTDIPEYDIDRSSKWVHSLPKFGINDSALSFVLRWGEKGSEEAQFNEPNGIAIDRDNFIYVVDAGSCRIQKFDNSGKFVSSWGSYGTEIGQFVATPRWITVDDGPYKMLYVTDIAGNVYIFNQGGESIAKWTTATTGESPGVIGGIVVDENYNIYVTDISNHNLKKFSFGGTLLAKWGSEGSEDGQFYYPTGIAIDSLGSIFVADFDLHRIQKFDRFGNFVAKWDVKIESDRYSRPIGIDIDENGNVWVADFGSPTIKKFDSNGKFMLKWGWYGMVGGANDFYFYSPMGIAVDNSGNTYLTEDQRCRVQKFKE